jgi:hypothetical protein
MAFSCSSVVRDYTWLGLCCRGSFDFAVVVDRAALVAVVVAGKLALLIYQ